MEKRMVFDTSVFGSFSDDEETLCYVAEERRGMVRRREHVRREKGLVYVCIGKCPEKSCVLWQKAADAKVPCDVIYDPFEDRYEKLWLFSEHGKV